MKVAVLYHPNREHERAVLDYVRDYRLFKGADREIDMVSLETVEGAHKAKVYDIVRYPAILAISNDGVLQKAWQGVEEFPILNEIDFYASSNG